MLALLLYTAGIGGDTHIISLIILIAYFVCHSPLQGFTMLSVAIFTRVIVFLLSNQQPCVQVDSVFTRQQVENDALKRFTATLRFACSNSLRQRRYSHSDRVFANQAYQSICSTSHRRQESWLEGGVSQQPTACGASKVRAVRERLSPHPNHRSAARLSRSSGVPRQRRAQITSFVKRSGGCIGEHLAS